MPKTLVRNPTGSGVTMPEPYRRVLGPGEGVIVEELAVNVVANIGGPDSPLRIQAVPDSNVPTVGLTSGDIAGNEGAAFPTVGVATVQNTEQPTTAQVVNVRYSSQINPIPLEGQTESCGLYGRVDQELNQNRWLMYLEVTDGGLGITGADASGGGIKAFHSGNSDFLDVIIMDGTDPDVQPVGVEVATYKPGSRNFISTLQYLGGVPVDCANTLFYSVLVDSPVVSNFAQLLFQKTPGHAITAQLYDGINGGGPAANPGQAMFRIVETDYARNLWTVFNSGRTDLLSTRATVGSQIEDSPELTLVAAYWDGAASQDRSFQIIHSMTAAAPEDSAAFFKIGDITSELTALVMRNNNGVVSHDYQGTDITTLANLTMQDASSVLSLNGGDINNANVIQCVVGGGSLDLQGGPISNATSIDGSSYARMLGFAADGDPGGLAATIMMTNVTAVGDGADTAMQAPALGTGSGPASLVATGFMKMYNGVTTVWVPFFE